jgi:hypothetical protein
MKTLRFIAAILLVSSFAQFSFAQTLSDALPLGTWKVTSMQMNGQTYGERQILGTSWTFTATGVQVANAQTQAAFDATVQDDYIILTEPGDDTAVGWIKFELSEQALRVAYYNGFQERPESFDADSSEPNLIVVQLQQQATPDDGDFEDL